MVKEFEKNADSVVDKEIKLELFGGTLPSLNLMKSGNAYLVIEMPPFYDNMGNQIEDESQFPEAEYFDKLLYDYIGNETIREDREVFLIKNATEDTLLKVKEFLENFWILREKMFEKTPAHQQKQEIKKKSLIEIVSNVWDIFGKSFSVILLLFVILSIYSSFQHPTTVVAGKRAIGFLIINFLDKIGGKWLIVTIFIVVSIFVLINDIIIAKEKKEKPTKIDFEIQPQKIMANSENSISNDTDLNLPKKNIEYFKHLFMPMKVKIDEQKLFSIEMSIIQYEYLNGMLHYFTVFGGKSEYDQDSFGFIIEFREYKFYDEEILSHISLQERMGLISLKSQKFGSNFHKTLSHYVEIEPKDKLKPFSGFDLISDDNRCSIDRLKSEKISFIANNDSKVKSNYLEFKITFDFPRKRVKIEETDIKYRHKIIDYLFE